jgi:hypothetical protein
MKTTIFTIIFMLGLLGTSFGQLKQSDNLMGGTLGFWARNNAPTFGFNYENQVTQAGIGTIGLGVLLRYSNFNNNRPYKYSNTFIGGQGNYNFNQVGNGTFVPFLGVVLGFFTASSDEDSYKENGLWAWGQAGARYFFSPAVAGVLRFGLGNFNFNAVELGVDFKF